MVDQPLLPKVRFLDERGNVSRAWLRYFIALQKEIGDPLLMLASDTVNLQHGDSKTVVYTVPTGKTAVITHVVIRSPSDTLAGGTEFDIGSGLDADTWRQTIDLSSMTVSTDYMVIPSIAATPVKYTLEAAGAEFGIRPIFGADADATATMEVWGYVF